jgi:dUTP pyrophosphatase
MAPLGVKKLSYDARLPTRGSDGAVGYDLYSSEDATVPCQAGRALVGTGIALDYTGEVKVVLFNHGTEDFEIKKGDRIAQLILERCETPMIKEIGLLEETLRGGGGFGSTGL